MKAAGNLNIIELPPLTRWTRNNGRTVMRRFTGPNILLGTTAGDTRLGTTAQKLRDAGIEHEMEREPGKFATITATYNGDENQDPNTPLSDQWILDINELEKNIWELPAIVNEFAKAMSSAHPPIFPGGPPLTIQESAYAAAQVKRDLKSIIAGEVIEHDGTFLTLAEVLATAGVLGMNQTLLYQFVQDLVKGVESFEIDQYVIRRTRVVTEDTAINALDQNIRRMIKTASMLSLEKAPATFPVIGKLPDGYWLKKRPKAEPASAGRWTIHQEYWHSDDFSRLIYGDPL